MELPEKDKLEWMYKGGSNSIDREEYLLGRAVDRAFERSEFGSTDKNEAEKDCLPQSIFSNAGSSIQVDIFRKKQEDPLEAIRQREIECRKQLLKNPIKLKKLQNMLKEQSKLKGKGSKKRKKKKYSSKSSSSDNDEDLDTILASKYMKLFKKYGSDKLKSLKKVESSSESRSSSDSEGAKRKSSTTEKKKKDERKEEGEKVIERPSHKPKEEKYEQSYRRESVSKEKYYKERSSRQRRKSTSSSESSPVRRPSKRDQSKYASSENKDLERRRKKEVKKRYSRRQSSSSSSESSECDSKKKKNRIHEKLVPQVLDRDTNKEYEEESGSQVKKPYGLSVPDNAPRPKREADHALSKASAAQKVEAKAWKKPQAKVKLSEEEKERKRREMMDNARWRDEMRVKNVKRYKDEEEKEKKEEKEYDSEFLRKQMSTVITVHGSVEDRIKSNINCIQRTKLALDKKFTKR